MAGTPSCPAPRHATPYPIDDPFRAFVLSSLHEGITRALDLMGIDTDSLEQSMDSIKRVCLARNGMTEQDVLRDIEERAEARKAKDFAKSDQVR